MDPLWWSVWWPWALVWTLTVACLIGLAVVVWWPGVGRSARRYRVLRVGYHLDRAAVADLHRSGYGPGLDDLDADPADLIRTVLALLDAADDLVQVDLGTSTVGTARPESGLLAGQPQWRLRDLDTFLVLRGTFREVANAVGTVTLAAPYGDPADPAMAAQVQLTCRVDDLHTDLPAEPFPAYCLAKAHGWNRRDRRLVVDPIALFR